MKILVVCQDFRHWRSGQDAAVHAVVVALAKAGGDVTVAAGRLHPGAEVAGVRLRRLPCLPIWHGSLQFLTFRAAWRFFGSAWSRSYDAVYLTSPLFGRGDVAATGEGGGARSKR